MYPKKFIIFNKTGYKKLINIQQIFRNTYLLHAKIIILVIIYNNILVSPQNGST